MLLGLAACEVGQQNIGQLDDTGDSTGVGDEVADPSTDESTDDTDDSSGSCPEPPPIVPGPDVPDGCEQVDLFGCTPDEPSDAASGWVVCSTEQGNSKDYRRIEAIECRYEHTPPACPGEGTWGGCTTDNDCGDGEHCLAVAGDVHCECVRPCMSDADCSADELCQCAGRKPNGAVMSDWNLCLPAQCRVGDDCEGGEPLDCRIAYDQCRTPIGTRCSTPADTCTGWSDCGFGEICTWWPDEHSAWTCATLPPCE